MTRNIWSTGAIASLVQLRRLTLIIYAIKLFVYTFIKMCFVQMFNSLFYLFIIRFWGPPGSYLVTRSITNTHVYGPDASFLSSGFACSCSHFSQSSRQWLSFYLHRISSCNETTTRCLRKDGTSMRELIIRLPICNYN